VIKLPSRYLSPGHIAQHIASSCCDVEINFSFSKPQQSHNV
jgi:hypothetical protein